MGELIANQFSVGLSRMARLVKERMSINTDPEKISLDDLVNARTVSAVIQAFFGSSQLSQFMDQTNPLAELTHKRRLSALGPGGLTRERAGFEVRDVHYSQYGRMCPIETPEGPNIGLITSLATYARVNDLGFIETPYRVVKNGKVTGRDRAGSTRTARRTYVIAQANAQLNADGTFADELVLCRQRGDFPLAAAGPDRLHGRGAGAAGLDRGGADSVPRARRREPRADGLEHAAPGGAAPQPRTPLVGTGLEEKVARDSGAVIIARRAGVVRASPPTRSSSTPARPSGARRATSRWRGSRSTTATGQEVLAHQPGHRDQPAPAGAPGPEGEAGRDHRRRRRDRGGELALGSNVTVAFMPWYGHNFEDAIVSPSGW